MKRILFVADGVAATGFRTVSHNIISNLPQEEYDIHHLAVNYFGDPHEFSWKIYPAFTGGDLLGIARLKQIASAIKFDAIFILNDIWLIDKYLEALKEIKIELPKIIIYFPVDSSELENNWFKHMDIVQSINVYTKFAQKEVILADESLNVNVIPHGIDTKTFFKLPMKRDDIKRVVFPQREDLEDSFIVLNANRNQPRKRMDLTIEGFSLFAEGKPKNVMLYLHCGIIDTGFDIIRLARRYNIEDRLILSNLEMGTQKVSEQKLNYIYNATEVGINTSFGEGWGLVNHEHAVTGAVQILPDHSACRELFNDCGVLIPIKYKLHNTDTLTLGSYISSEDIASGLNKIYYDKEYYNKLSIKGFNKLSNEKYHWNNIVKKYWLPIFKEVTDGYNVA